MGNEQSIISQKHLVDPADARLVQQFREARAANRVSEQQSSAQHQAWPPGEQSFDQRPHGEPAGAIMSPGQHLSLSGQGETLPPTRRANQRSSSEPKTPPSRTGSRRRRSRSKSPTSSKKSTSRQSANADRNGSELPSLASGQSDPIPTSPLWYPQCYEEDPSSEGSDDPDDPCLKIRHGKRRLRVVLKELQEMYRASLARELAQDKENEELRKETQRLREANRGLQDYTQDLHLDNERFCSMNTQLHEDIRGLREDLQYHSAANRQAGTRLLDLRNELEDLRETNGDPQNENAELRRSNRNLRADLHDHLEMYEEIQELRGANSHLYSELEDLREQTGGGIADWTRRYDELERMAGEAEDASDRLRLRLGDVEPRLLETNRQLARAADEITRLQATQDDSDRLRQQPRDVETQLAEANQHLDQANNENTQLQATLDWILEGNSDPADSGPARPTRSRGSSASRDTPSPGAQDPTPRPSPSPSPPRARRMNTRSQVTGDAASRTPPPELFSPQRERRTTRQRNASKPSGVSKPAKRTKKTTTMGSRN